MATLRTFEQKTTSEETVSEVTPTPRQRIIVEIRQLQQDAIEQVVAYKLQIEEQTVLIVNHAVYNNDDDDDDDDEVMARLRRDKHKMQAIVDDMYELRAPIHPYCQGCNRQEGGPHPGQRAHMGHNGCLNFE